MISMTKDLKSMKAKLVYKFEKKTQHIAFIEQSQHCVQQNW